MDDLILGGIMLYFFSQARKSNKNTTNTSSAAEKNTTNTSSSSEKNTTTTTSSSEKNTTNPDKENPTTSLCKLSDVDFSLFTNSPAKGRGSSNQIFRLFIDLLVNKNCNIESMNAKIYFDDTEVNHIKSKMQLHLNAGQTTRVILRSKKDLTGIVPVEAIGDGMAFNLKIKGSFKTSSGTILSFILNKKIEDVTHYMHTDLFDENKTASKRYIDTPLIFSDPNRNGYFYYEYGTKKYTNTLFKDLPPQDDDRRGNQEGVYTGTEHSGRTGDEKDKTKTGNELLLEKFGNTDKNYGTTNTRTGRGINYGTGDGRSSGHTYKNGRRGRNTWHRRSRNTWHGRGRKIRIY